MYRPHTEEVPALLKTMLSPSWIPSRFTRASASFGSYAVQCFTGKTESGHWSLVQYDHSYVPTIIPVWNSLPDATVGHPTTSRIKAFCSRAHKYLKNLVQYTYDNVVFVCTILSPCFSLTIIFL